MDKIFSAFRQHINKLRKNHTFLLVSICILAFILRFYKLGEIPSFHTDEADFAHNAYFMLETGKDQTGQSFPIATTSTGDRRPAVYVYLSLLPIKLLGLTVLAARLPSLLFSVATVAATYFLALGLLKNKNIALISSFLITVSFWHIMLSREASEKSVALFFVVAGSFFVIRFFTSYSIKALLLGLVLLFISTHTYYSPRIFLLLLLPLVWFLMHKKVSHTYKIVSFSLMCIFIVTTVYFTFLYKGNAERINQLLIFNNPYTTAVLGEQIREDGGTGNILITRIFHNKVQSYALTLLGNYLLHYSPDYLLFEGGKPERMQVPQVGLINLVEVPFLIIGIYFLVLQSRQQKQNMFLLLPLWVLLSAVPSAFTFDEIPNMYRTSLMVPALSILVAYGIWKAFSWRNSLKKAKYIFLTCFILLYSWFVGYFLHQYFVHFERHRPLFRNYAQKELGLLMKESFRNYDTIYVTKAYGGTEQILRFYMQYSPKKYEEEGYPKDDNYKGFGNIVFVPDDCPFPKLYEKLKLDTAHHYLFINNHLCTGEFVQKQDIIRWNDQSQAYKVIDSQNVDLVKMRMAH